MTKAFNITKKRLDNLVEQDIKDINFLIDNSEQSTFFHTIEWNEIISKINKLECFYLILRYKKYPISVFPFFILPFFGLFKIRTSSSLETRYGGPISLFRSSDILRTMLTSFEKSLCCLIWYTLIPPIKNPNYLSGYGYKYKERHSSIIDLTCDSKDLWNNLNKKTRYGVRKSLENNLEIDISDKIELEEFYELLKEVIQRALQPTFPQ